MGGGVALQWLWTEKDGIRALAFAGLPGAYFTTRHGGVSQGPFASLNWSYFVGDERGRVAENRRRGVALAGVTPERSVVAGLVHGCRVARVDRPGVGIGERDACGFIPDCDGLVTAVPGLALVITAADCLPVYLHDRRRGAVALGHAGWRGTVQGLAAALVQAMRAHFGSRPEDLTAVVGPGIGPCCYEVDDQVVVPLARRYGDWRMMVRENGGGRYQLDLWEANRRDLVAAGLPEAQVHAVRHCTAHDPANFFSHRKEGGLTGRQAAVFVLTEDAAQWPDPN